jgi:hypothetical protein
MGLPAVRSKNGSEEIGLDRREMGQADTLRYNVATYVVEEKYDRAIEELRGFLEADSEFPKFKERVSRYVEHSVDLINAIRAKRKFPGASSLTMAKQQELKERFHEHFAELQQVLKNIDRIHTELKIDDIRSTVWVVKALVNSVLAVVLSALVIEASHGLGTSLWLVAEEALVSVTNAIFSVLGF